LSLESLHFRLNHDETYGKKLVPMWIAGAPRKTWWMGLRLGSGEQIEVATYRCRRCGYLESYP